MEELEGSASNRAFVATMVRIYSDAAALQYEEAERLMCIALAAKEHADGLMARCADLVAESLEDDIPW